MSSSMFLTDYSSYSTARIVPLTRSPIHRSAVSMLLPRLADSIHMLPLCISTSFKTRPFAINASLTSNDALAKLIDGMLVAKQIREEIAEEVTRMKNEIGVVPGLGVILVGDSMQSVTNVSVKKRACDAVGINFFEVRLPESASQNRILDSIWKFNRHDSVHGIKVQLPLPSHINENKIVNAVRLEKDVDGCNPWNIGRLALRGRKEPLFLPCTPLGCIELLHRCDVEIKGKRAVVIGRSDNVAIPAALLLQREDATVSVVHSRTKNPEEITKQADILIAASGKPKSVRANWIKPGAVVIDVGAVVIDVGKNDVMVSSFLQGDELVGDVCYEEACKVASAITPVPGGVGHMTIAMLLSNTLSAARSATSK